RWPPGLASGYGLVRRIRRRAGDRGRAGGAARGGLVQAGRIGPDVLAEQEHAAGWLSTVPGW
ncbi:MAG TPA: hypothetical protein VHS32_39410, partial [Streptosporangiaceae bacterium]|nr:hypothetical protein [Streptosporangiaceae bacterium]